MLKNNDFQKAVEIINKSHNVLITTHTRPDGDAAGCCVALNEALSSLGKKTQMVILSPLPQWYGFLFGTKASVLGQDLTPEQLAAGGLGKFDLIIIVDTNTYSQLPKIDAYLKQKPAPILIIDHHATSDRLGSVELVDTKAAAACMVVLGLFKFASWPITPRIAEALFTGIATDTGWFHFNNTNADVLRTCAELIDAGANPPQIHQNIYSSFTVQRFRLMTAMQNNIELHFNNSFATQYITQQDLKNTGAQHEDTENLIDECRRIATVKAAALFVELSDGRIRCSLRSDGVIDVCKIAAKFGGGGHTAAAGAYIPGPLENAKKLILTAVENGFSSGRSGH
jgi:phosphoesterase RecJ-like protein